MSALPVRTTSWLWVGTVTVTFSAGSRRNPLRCLGPITEIVRPSCSTITSSARSPVTSTVD